MWTENGPIYFDLARSVGLNGLAEREEGRFGRNPSSLVSVGVLHASDAASLFDFEQ